MCEDVEITLSVGCTVLCNSESSNKHSKLADVVPMVIGLL